MDESSKPSRRLSMSEVNRVLSGAQNKERLASLAPSKADDIFKRHSKQLLTLLDGKVDSITIEGHVLYASKRDGRESMYVRPKGGFVPCGEISRQYLLGNLAG